ncbi:MULTISPECIES: hypothetical protein [unclassified Methylophilus]|uniref:hypothetical protein n=1 Tax=unclassified Methylophilus TaxID=2630143 RepID=UPI000ABD6EA7|nr:MULTISPECIES: hypothetical protein [unclassified Methylophilus]
MAINLVSMNEEASGYTDNEYLAGDAFSNYTSEKLTHVPEIRDEFRQELQGRPNLEL